jgi:hypothetical protein
MSRVSLDRVVFVEPVNVPGAKADVYPTREEIVVSKERPNNRLSSKQHYILWHDDLYVYIQHPEAPDSEPEKVPMHNVLQMRETEDGVGPVAAQKKMAK